MRFSQIKLLRALVLPIFAKLNPGDITITHHYTGDRVRIHSYRHKGYWFHGRKREQDTMALFKKLLKKGDLVLEVGGHIGYIALYFRHLVGDGKVIVFEPGENNLPYLIRNVEGKGIEVVRSAIGREEGSCTFFLDNLSGQNNSMIQNFFAREDTEASSFDSKARGTQETTVNVTTVDRFVELRNIKPTFIKIDIEGFEFEALQGMHQTLERHQPILMVEIQTNHADIGALLQSAGYVMRLPNGQPFDSPRVANVFCFHSVKHAHLLDQIQKRHRYAD